MRHALEFGLASGQAIETHVGRSMREKQTMARTPRDWQQRIRTTLANHRDATKTNDSRSETRVKNALAVQSCAQWVLPKDSQVLAAVGNEDDLYFHGTRLLQSCWSKQHAQRA